MLKIENSKFREKFTEINIRQRLYEGTSYITLITNTEFYPALVGDRLVSGAIEIKLDIKDIKSLDDLEHKSYKGDIGSVTISVNNDGVWEHMSQDNFSVDILKREGRELTFKLESDNCLMETTGIMVSLYTTSSTEKELGYSFDLKDFYERPVTKKIGKNEIFKYFVKED